MKYIFLFFLFSIHINSQCLDIEYKTISKLDLHELAQKEDTSPGKLYYAKKIKEDNEALTFRLVATAEKSTFEMNPFMSLDSSSNMVAQMEMGRRIYVDRSELLFQQNFQGEDVIVQSKSFSLKWELLQQTEEIMGYKCFLATARFIDAGIETTIKAWYASKLTIPFGPKGFHGLPGLILKLERNELIVYEAVSINSCNNASIVPPTQGRIVSKEKIDERVIELTKYMRSQSKN